MDDRQDAPLDVAGLVGLAEGCLVAEGSARSELSISFVTEDEMAELHARYMGEDGATDVLSFPMGDDDEEEDGIRILGDVVVAPSVAARNNPEDLEGELRLLIVHGILHLLGHDHSDDAERADMWARQERYTGVSLGTRGSGEAS